MVPIGSGAERKMESYAFSCFAPDNLGRTELATNLYSATQNSEGKIFLDEYENMKSQIVI